MNTHAGPRHRPHAIRARTLALVVPIMAALVLVSSAGMASDHVDGLKTAIDNAADLTDLYTFVSPKDSTKLVLVLNVHGTASRSSRFSNAVDYKFRIRPVDPATLLPVGGAKAEKSVTCAFSGGIPFVDANQHATCVLDFGATKETVTFDTRSDKFTAGGSGQHGSTKVFAGVRSDSWFLDGAKTIKYVFTNDPVPPEPGKNLLQGQNVLSIVVEADKARFGGPLLAVTAQTVRR